jgi:succinyl-CoA synthetase beta subunit
MKIHEYQGKEILKKFGVPTPVGMITQEASEAAIKNIVDELGLPVVVKAQIHAGGRGKGGGVKVAKTEKEAHEAARAILGMNLVTHQTGPEGQKVSTLLLEEGMDIAREL